MADGYQHTLLFLFLVLIISACSGKEEPTLFESLEPRETGVHFTNTVTSFDSLNIQNYPFMFNGGGVAIGDINNDGLPDLYLTGNMVSSRLYLNKGNLQFEDITESAGVQTRGWASGIAMVDINADGNLDIYVSMVSPEYIEPDERANLLFINNGDSTFTESAADYNLDYKGFTTQSAFLDYDRDGDLDVYLLNHSPGSFSRNQDTRRPEMLYGQAYQSFDELYRNDGNGSFTRVTEQAGLSREVGFGLGVAVSDINRDGWPDIYISNDILPDDVLYINNGDGTFSDKIDEYLKHTSFAGMGIDIADFNNDGWPDISQVDMMPKALEERKQMSGGISYSRHQEMIEMGLTYQYSMNTLQLSNGVNMEGEVIFSDIARLAGVAYTDWSWSTLFGDYDNDGYKDLLITNGFPKAINNYDYLTEINQRQQFGTGEYRQQEKLELLEDLKEIKVPNHIFRNEGDLTFSDQTSGWGFGEPGFSYGASQSDLDNDGDLDIIVNNINEPVTIYRNNSDTLRNHNYLSIELIGSPLNIDGIGAKIILNNGSAQQYKYVSPYRGYQSSMDSRIHFGLKDQKQVDSLQVIWPDGRRQLLTDVEANRQITLNYEDAEADGKKERPSNFGSTDKMMTNITGRTGLEYNHRENTYNDYNIQGLLPYQLSKPGPPAATADVNNDGRADLFVGGAAGQSGTLFIQTEGGTFERYKLNAPWVKDRDFEDVGATFFDANGDGAPDLYVASGGYEFSPASSMLQDRLYLNTGNGSFVKNDKALPRMLTSSCCVRPADFDGDGDLDLFVGGRMVPRQYPRPPRSYLLRNDNGTFTDVTSQVAPELTKPGMITDATWSDYNGDGQVDLVTTGEWLPVQFYKNVDGSFSEVTEEMGMTSNRGWWYSLEQGDFDNDGDLDFVAGNLGMNYAYQTNEDQKFEVYASDFDKNQTMDLLFSIQQDGEHYPYYGKAKLGQHIPGINHNFETFKAFSEVTIEDILGSKLMKDALHLQVDTFASVYIENRGEDGFTVSELPNSAQISSVNDIISTDINKDGNLDLIIAGNNYYTEPETARNDAGNGLILIGDGNGGFNERSPFESGLLAPYQVSKMEIINTKNQQVLLIVNNDEIIQAFRMN
ncbi:VCBS repeat-containing protein [Halalkalibaculum sp. DA3122]